MIGDLRCVNLKWYDAQEFLGEPNRVFIIAYIDGFLERVEVSFVDYETVSIF